jgi:polyhydroxybutyrate depolymerase
MRKRLGIVLVAAAVLAGACSGDGGGEGDEGTEAEGSGTTTAEATGADRAAVPSAGCEAEARASEQADLAEATMTVRGAERRWLLSAPAWADGDEPLPVVLDFHGLGEGAEVHAEMSQLGPLGVEEGFVTVFPHGTGSPIRWNVDPAVDANADLGYVAALLDRVEEERCVDTSRVYATGLSNGAMMSSVVACSLSDRIAAIAPVAGIALPEGCEPSHPMPVLTFHGTADPILLFNGGVGGEALSAAMSGGDTSGTTTTLPPADLEGEGYPETVRGWAALAGCDETFEDEEVSATVTRRAFDCPAEAPVEFVVIEGGGHSWPSSEFSKSIERIVGPTTFDIDASAEAWAFFQQFSLPSA